MPGYTFHAEGGGQRSRRRRHARKGRGPVVALAGSPNAGKTTLFNLLTGLRARTANFAGTTVEFKRGWARLGEASAEIVDLPGMYSLSSASPEEQVASEVLLGKRRRVPQPDAVVVIADAGNLERGLFLASQLFEHCIPTILALNMIDVAEKRGIHVDAEKLSKEIGCPVVPMVARTGQGVDTLRDELEKLLSRVAGGAVETAPGKTDCGGCASCPFEARYAWSDNVTSRCVDTPAKRRSRRTDHIDAFLTHPIFGVLAFLGVMLSVFYLIFSVASIPMDLIDKLFAGLGGWVSRVVPEGEFQSLLVDGVIGGVGGILVFLPQICILFLFLALLEDSGYLARAAFVMDRLMRSIGLPGTAFVPLLSAHACAIPAIMASRVIADRRDRLVTILVAPLVTCSARIPVYAMVTALLFPRSPGFAALVFTGAYGLGVAAALTAAFVLKKTILPGESKPLVMELPEYHLPSLRNALLYTGDRARVFIRQAGSIILVISIVLWALATYPRSEAPPEAVQLRAKAAALAAEGEVQAAEAAVSEAEKTTAQHALASSFAGRLGRLIEPVVRPLGFDWQIGIGVVSSFAAREVIVSTLSIVYGLGEDAGDEEGQAGLYNTLRTAQRADGSPVFTAATSVSLLVFYVLAMQCLPTQAVTKRETGSWRWPLFQLAYMSCLAYGTAFIAYNVMCYFGLG